MAFQLTIANNSVQADRPPNQCPICNHAVAPRQLTGIFHGMPGYADSGAEVIYQCVRFDCESAFIGYYKFDGLGAYSLVRTAPSEPSVPSTPEEVAEVSPQFAKIRSQASAAETYGLDEIAGGGYRKALEFLIKDFCVSQHKNKENAIKSAFLGDVIETYVSDANIKECAKRATWLGNDETHYVRRWEEKDIRDLKVLIDLTVSWIRSHILTQRYLADMPAQLPR